MLETTKGKRHSTWLFAIIAAMVLAAGFSAPAMAHAADDAQRDLHITAIMTQEDSGPGTPTESQKANATTMSLDTPYTVVWKQGAVTWFKYTAEDTGYYSISTAGGFTDDYQRIYFHDPSTWESQDPTVAGSFRVFLIKGSTYYFGAITVTPDGSSDGGYEDYKTVDGEQHVVSYSMTLSSQGFEAFTAGCESWSTSGSAEGETKEVTFGAVQNGYYYKPLAITASSDGSYRFTAYYSEVFSTTWPILLDADGAVLDGPDPAGAQRNGTVAANLSAGQTCYLVPGQLHEVDDNVILFTAKADNSEAPAEEPAVQPVDEVQTDDITVPAEGEVGDIHTSPTDHSETNVKAPSSIALAAQKKTYTGRALAYTGTVTRQGSTGEVTYAYYSNAECTKAVEASNVKNAGTYYVKATVAADANYAAATSEPVKFTIAKKANTLKVKAAKSKLSAKANKKTTFSRAKAFKVTKNASKGKLTYKKRSGNKKIAVSSAGKITVKKGLKKGTYTVKVNVTSKATTNYKAAKKTVTLKVKVA